MNKEIIIDGVDVSDWADEEVRYKFEKHSPKAIRQIAFDLYNQLKRKEQECEDLRTHCKHIDETNKILYNEKVQLLDKNQELQDKLLKLNDLAHEVLLYELQTLDIDFDEYETHVRDTEFSPIVTRCTEMINLIGYSDKCNKEI